MGASKNDGIPRGSIDGHLLFQTLLSQGFFSDKTSL